MNRRIDEIAERLRRESDPSKSTDDKLEDGSTAEWITNSEADVAWLLKRLDQFIKASRTILQGLDERISKADPSAVPVFDGIADLHTALARATETVDHTGSISDAVRRARGGEPSIKLRTY